MEEYNLGVCFNCPYCTIDIVSDNKVYYECKKFQNDEYEKYIKSKYSTVDIVDMVKKMNDLRFFGKDQPFYFDLQTNKLSENNPAFSLPFECISKLEHIVLDSNLSDLKSSEETREEIVNQLFQTEVNTQKAWSLTIPLPNFTGDNYESIKEFKDYNKEFIELKEEFQNFLEKVEKLRKKSLQDFTKD